MKKSTMRLMGLMALFALVLSVFAFATDYSDLSPIDGAYDLDGNAITLNVSVTPTTGQNISNITFFTNVGTWSANQTYSYTGDNLQDTSRTVGMIVNTVDNASIADGTDFIWSVEVGLNGSNSTSGTSYSSNRTVNVEFPPDIEVKSPASGFLSSGLTQIINFTPTSAFTTSAFTCQLVTNESGSEAVQRSGLSVTNNTDYLLDYAFEELSDIRYSISCKEATTPNVVNSSINYTIGVDRTGPTVSISAPSEGGYFNAVPFNITRSVSDSVAASNCSLFVNDSLESVDLVLSTTNHTVATLADGVYSAIVGCADTSNNKVNSTAVGFILDTVAPALSLVKNDTITGFNDRLAFSFTTDELANSTVFYGTTVDTSGASVDNSSYTLAHNVTITDFAENTVFYWNITSCDQAGNCNTSGQSYDQFDWTFPWKVYTGWTYWGLSDASISFSDILTASQTEYIYWWNQTDQSWTFATAGGATNQNFLVGQDVGNNGGRQVIALYEETNSTWDRNDTQPADFYHYNFTSGDNFIAIPRSYTMGNFSLTLFNGSLEYDGKSSINPGFNYNLEEIQGADGFTYNMTDFWFSAYNRTGSSWETDYVYNFTLNNNTAVNPLSENEVLWVWSDYNVSWNGTNIYRNWTR
jgi:hypothetical protein